MTTPAEVRRALADTLELDLVGPRPGHPLEGEALRGQDRPSHWYLTGFLVPTTAPASQRFDPEGMETLDTATLSEDGAGDDDDEPDKPPAREVALPSSMGISVLVQRDTTSIDVTVSWGDYKLMSAGDPAHPEWKVWRRLPFSRTLTISLENKALAPIDVPDGRGVKLYVSRRDVTLSDAETSIDARSVSVFIVNERNPEEEDRAEEANVFQASLTLHAPAPSGFCARPNLRGLKSEDEDERIADLHYRDACEYAVGHGVSTHASVDERGRCHEVSTTWVPKVFVEKVDPAPIPGVELSMERLAVVNDTAEAQSLLGPLSHHYRTWIAAQRASSPHTGERGEIAIYLLERCADAERRIAQGLEELSDPLVLEAFRVTNKAMAMAARQRSSQSTGRRPRDTDVPRWRPFQIAFLIMNLPGLVHAESADRDVADLLFFPTGGGKTEAYLGLAAFAITLRRLRDPSVLSAGVNVLMRYTLRLLTLDQLARASTLVCALELIRQADVERFGTWPFEIGLWVGRRATPNRMGKKGDGDRHSARARTIAYKGDSRHKPPPIPLERCPWCGTDFVADSFSLVPGLDQPTDLRITCRDDECAFTRDNPLPIVAVDDTIYRRLPCFLIATVDKVASLPWLAGAGKLFGKVDRCDKAGFYGPGDPAGGAKLQRPLLPPDLVIQDELHLISGPLGTMVGLYETAVDGLATRKVGDREVRPKVVASTATIRRAAAQVRAIFTRDVEVFPPPGPDRRDSFFARASSHNEDTLRLYVGVAAQGRSLKVVLLRSYLALLSAAKKHYEALGGAGSPRNAADPYMTLIGYFNALRELGGSRRIVEDEVRSGLQARSNRRRSGEVDPPFADRIIQFNAIELTSREPTDRVAASKERLSNPFAEEKRVDVALATNMISVGLDIARLGLMVVLGQPKTTAEYIQATSRVGRDPSRPGLVVTLLNVHRPRDRSHYERFEAYHQSFYRSVEATSVTPFAPRALDRGLAAVVVALARHGERELTHPARAADVARYRAKIDWIERALKRREEAHKKGGSEPSDVAIGSKVESLLDDWEKIAAEKNRVQAGLQYGANEAPPRPALLHDPLDPDLEREPSHSRVRRFRAQWSLRDVEPEVPILVQRLERSEEEV